MLKVVVLKSPFRLRISLLDAVTSWMTSSKNLGENFLEMILRRIKLFRGKYDKNSLSNRQKNIVTTHYFTKIGLWKGFLVVCDKNSPWVHMRSNRVQ